MQRLADDETQLNVDGATLPGLRGLRDLLRQRRGVRAVLANIGWLWADSAVLFVASSVAGIIVARALGPADYGLLGYATGFMGLFVPLAGLGLMDLAIRDLVASKVPAERILGTTFALQAAGALLAVLLAWACGLALRDDPLTRRVTLITCLSMLATPLNVPAYWFAARVRSKYAVWARDGALLVGTVLRGALALSGASVVVFAWLAVVQAFLAGLALLALSRGRLPDLRTWTASLSEAGRMLREAWPLLAAGLAVALYMKIDLVMLGQLAGPDEVGQYTAAVRLSELWHVVPVAISLSVFPTLVRARHRQTHDSDGAPWMQAFYDLMAGLGYLIAVPVSLLGVPVARLVYGQQYAASGPVLVVHIWTFLFVCLGLARCRWLVAANLNRLLLYTSLIGAAVNVGLNLLLIPRFGAQGAAWATVASQTAANYGACLVWPQLREAWAQMTRALLLPLRLRSAWHGAKAVWRSAA